MVSTTVALGLTAGTLVVFTGLGLWYSRGRVETIDDFLTARNTTSSGMVTATLIASSMGGWILFSPAEAGAAFGGLSAVLGYAIGSALPLIVYTRVGPRVRRLLPQGHSLTEYVFARYGRWMYAYVLVISIFYMFIALSAEMTGIAGALALVAGVPPWQTAGLIGVFVLIYTGYGGLVASIFTDTVQTLVILPLLLIGFVGALLSLGGVEAIHASITARNPQILQPDFLPGLEFGSYVMIAILGASMFNQGDWQRIFAAENTYSVERGFGMAALVVLPMIFLAGLFGMAAAGLGFLDTPGDASIAVFVLLDRALPEWLTLLVILLAVLLVMSTADTWFNAIVSIITAELPRVLSDPDERRLTRIARGITVVVALGAILIGAQGYSVLQLFLLADLLASATFFPYIFGLYSERVTQRGALAASIAGLVVGVLFYPTLRGGLTALGIPSGVLPAPSFLLSFGGAALVSVLITVSSTRLTDDRFELEELSEEIRAMNTHTTNGESPAESHARSGTDQRQGGDT